MSIDKGSWGFRRDVDLAQLYSMDELISLLIRTVRYVWSRCSARLSDMGETLVWVRLSRSGETSGEWLWVRPGENVAMGETVRCLVKLSSMGETHILVRWLRPVANCYG